MQNKNTQSIEDVYNNFKKDFLNNKNIKIIPLYRITYRYTIINKQLIKSLLLTAEDFLNKDELDLAHFKEISDDNLLPYLFYDASKSDVKNGIIYGFVRKFNQFIKTNNKTSINDFKSFNLINLTDKPTKLSRNLRDSLIDNINKNDLKELLNIGIRINKKVYYLDSFKPGTMTTHNDDINFPATNLQEYEQVSYSWYNLENFCYDKLAETNTIATNNDAGAIYDDGNFFILPENFLNWTHLFFNLWLMKNISFKNTFISMMTKSFLLRLANFYLNEVEKDLNPKQAFEVLMHILNNYKQNYAKKEEKRQKNV